MSTSSEDTLRRILLLLFSFSLTIPSQAAAAGSIRGTVLDPLGAAASNATVTLLLNSKAIATASTDPQGSYSFPNLAAGRYQVRASAPSFETTAVDVPYISGAGESRVSLTLSVPSLEQQITVTATGLPTPVAQLGSAVSVLPMTEYEQLLDVHEALKSVPGLQSVQVGQRGATTSLFIRGGYANYNKVLLDGIPADDIGGNVEFGDLATTGIDSIEVLRAPNSALYGSDALAGVVNLNTMQGTTPLPEISYLVDGGNFSTLHQEGRLAGAFKRLDYFSDYSRFDSRNSEPNSAYHNGTFAGNLGLKAFANTSIRGTVRHLATADGNANAFQLYGIPDDAVQREQDTYAGVTVDNQTTARWHNLARYGALRLRGQFTDYSPTGQPYDTFFGPVYLGEPVTLRGANGYTVSGQATFQYPGTYPSQFFTSTDRDFVYAQSDYKLTAHFVALAAFKYEHERGNTLSSGFGNTVDRTNYGSTAEIKGDIRNRLYYTLGTGIEGNELYGVKATPRASLAYYLFRPAAGSFSGTKLRFSFSQGIKEPSIYYQTNSLYELLLGLPGGDQLISQYHVSPIGPERARNYEAGVDQQFLGGRAKLGITYFHNQFSDGIEYVPQPGLVSLGVPAAVAQATQFGAAVNSQRLRAEGAEAELEYRLANSVFIRGGYTYLAALVQRSFSSDAVFPSINPSFPDISIGAFSPLVGNRPFRRAPHSGYFGVDYNHSRWTAAFSGILVGKRDDSDFLFDKDGGTTLLLPNRNLDAAYQRFDLSGSYQVCRSLSLYTSVENLFSQHYSEAFGYPGLPFAFRSGIKIALGGESWKLK